MIATLTLNPAIDKNLSVPTLIPEVKMRCSAITAEPGGGGVNISKAIQELGGKSVAVYPAGGATGVQLQQLIGQQLAESCCITVSGDTRENFNVDELTTNRQYRFITPGPSLTPAEQDTILHTIKSLADVSLMVCSGSLPPGLAPDYISTLAEIAIERGIKFIADTSGEALKMALSKGSFLIKPNMTELKFLAKKDNIEERDVAFVARQLLEQHSDTTMLVVSMGAGGAMLVTRKGCTRFRAPIVKKVSTVGAGDSMVAGIIWMLEQQHSIEEAVQFGVACGTAATIQAGTRLFRKADAERMFSQVTKETIANC